jgi:hypothetical protein
MTTASEMSWDEIKTLIAELAIQSKETDRRFQETEAQMREVFARFDNLSRRLATWATAWASSSRRWSNPRWSSSFGHEGGMSAKSTDA